MLALLLVAPVWGAAASERGDPTASARAATIARDSRPRWRVGRLDVRTSDRRGRRIEAELLVDGTVVARLRVDPATGGFLGRREAGRAPVEPPDLERLRGLAAVSLARVDVGDWAWPMEHGRAWGVPLQYEGRVVGRLAVDVRQQRILAAHDED